MSVYFTPREKQVLKLASKAMLRKKIASHLDISIRTVDVHLNKIHIKTNTTTMAELVLFAATAKKAKK